MAPSSSPTEDRPGTGASDGERRETERLAALDHLGAVRPEVDSVLQQLVDDVCEVVGTDLCMVNLVLSDVQYFRAWSGKLPEDLAEARQDPRERSMCQYVVETERPLVVEDFLATEKFKDQYFRVNYGIRFYAGTPLVTSDGYTIGTLCLLGTQPREIGEEQMTLLGAFAKAVVGRLELLGALGREQAAREDETRRSRELQRTLDSSQDVIATVGADGAFETMNRAAERVLGYEAAELIGRNYLELVHPDDRDLSTRLTGVIEDGTRECRFENRCLCKDGGVVYVEWNVTAIPEEGVAHCVARDVTERTSAEEELRKSEARHRTVVETAEDAILTMTTNGMIRSFNPGAERMFGYKAEEAIGQPLRMLMPERFRGPHEVGFRRYLETGEAHVVGKGPVELAGLRKSGEEFPLELTLGELREEGDVLFTGIIRDITDRKKAEHVLRENEKRFRQLFNQSVDTLFVHDASGRIVDCNEEACRSLGYTREELLSLRIKDLATNLVSDEDVRSRPEPTLWQRALSGEPGRVAGVHQGEHMRKDGTTFPVEVYVGSVDYGGERMIFASARDITERKEAEEALKESEERFHSLTDAALEGIVILEGGRVLEANRACTEMFGYEMSEIVGKSALDFIAPESVELVRRNMFSGYEQPYEAIGVRKDGTRFDQEIQGRAFTYRGRAVRVTAMRDITQRKRAEADLIREREFLTTVLESLKEGIVACDAEGNLTLFNQATREFHGITESEITPDEWARHYDLYLADGRTPMRQEDIPLFRAYNGENVRDAEMVIAPEDGPIRTLLANGQAFYDGEGNKLGAVVAMNDITERKRAGEALQESEERLRLALEAGSLGTWYLDLKSGEFVASPRAKALHGLPAEDRLDNQGALDAVHPEDREAVGEKVARAISERESYEAEYRVVWPEGTVRWLAAHGRVYGRDEDGRGERLVGVVHDITERKRAEEELQEAEERFRSLSQATFEGICITESRKIIETNDVFASMFGYEPSELPGKTPFDVIAPESHDLIRHNLSIGSTEAYEAVGMRKDGTRFEVEIRGRQSRFLGRDVRAAAVRDITERKRTEEEIRQLNETLERRVEERTADLKASEERYSLVVEGSNDGIFDWDIRTGDLYWNDRFFEILGLSGSETTPTFDLFADLLHPQDRERVMRALNAHLEHGEKYEEEFRMRRSDGEYRICVGRGKAQRDENERPFRMAGSVTDITERKRNEEALSFLAEASSVLASSLDYQTTLASVARLAVPRLADWCAVDMVEEDGSLERLAVVHEDPEKVRWARELQERYPDPPDAPYGIPKVLRTGELEYMSEIPEPLLEETIQDAGHLEILRMLGLRSYMIVPLVARGRTLGAITFVAAESGRRYDAEDLELAEELARRAELAVDNARLYDSARKELAERERAEEEVRKLNENLERRVEERTEQLEEAREAAEEANRAKSEFLANMSHEIRTPMNGIIGMTELLFDTGLSGEQREYAETVRYSSEALLTIINDILDFSKIEAGKMRIETTDFDLQTVVEEVVGLFAERAQDKGLELASLVEYDVPTALRGDPSRLRQILTNLLGNAVKFTEEGAVVLHVDLEESTEDRVVLRFEITDTGIGITEEQRGRLFRSFSQADASTTRRYGGTGLGLAISKQLVELMDGEIGIESEPGTGSTFWFTVPLREQPEGTRPAPRSFAANYLHDLRVLIVDDNPTNRRILSRQIAPGSMHCESAEDAPGALRILRASAERGAAYDLAILDMQMPGMDGMQLARAIKTDPSISATRLILLTSMVKRGDGQDAREAGIEAYLTKPVKQSELYDTIATVMGTPTELEAPREKQLVTRHSLREAKTRLLPRVLVAEDNPVNQKVATIMLQRLGYRADVASNGLEALEALSQGPYAAVLMDVQMPEMDGYEATAEIRRREGLQDRHTPIIAMTANAMQGDREKAIDAGMDDYVSKPVKPEYLGKVLKRWVLQDAPESDVTEPDVDSEKEEIEEPIDYTVLESLRELQQDGEPDLLVELVEIFLGGVPPQLAALREAVGGDDAGTIERVAHTLKGSCGNMGAPRMAKICAELQDAGSSGDLARASELLGRLEAEFGRVRPALEAEAKRSRS